MDPRQRNDRRRVLRGPERRMGDRRDSHRVGSIKIEVKVGNEDFQSYEGNLSIGGVYITKSLSLPEGAIVHMRLEIPGLDRLVQAKGEVVEDTSPRALSGTGTRMRFIDLDVESELLIARFLDSHCLD